MAKRTQPTLAVFADLPIPVEDAVSETYALLGKRNSGKSYTAMLLEEQLCDAGVFFVTLDPVGKHWALRSAADGKGPGKDDVWVLGGLHGDVPLDPASGGLIAQTVVDHPGRYVLDLSDFDTDAQADRFAEDFAKRLFRYKAKDPGWPLMLILEEAESFIPQQPQSNQTKMLGAYAKLMRQGRNHGIGMFLVSQRTQALNKGVLSQAEVLIVKQMSHNRDIAAVREWAEAQDEPEDVLAMMKSLAGLERDEAFVWSPSWLRTFQRTRVLGRVTFDSSASAKAGARVRQPTLAPLDVQALGEKIAAMAEKAREDDPAALRQQVRELQRSLAEARKAAPTAAPVVEPVQVPVLDKALVARVEKALTSLPSSGAPLGEVNGLIDQAVAKIAAATEGFDTAVKELTAVKEQVTAALHLNGTTTDPERPTPRPAAPRRHPAAPTNGGPGDRTASTPVAAGGGELTSPRQRLLDALADFEAIGVLAPSRGQLALWVGVPQTSGGFKNNLGALHNTLGLIQYPAAGTVKLTDEGRALARAQFPDGMTTEQLHAQIEGVLKNPRRWQIMQVAIDRYPDPISRDELAEALGVPPTSGGYKNNLGALRSLGFLDYPATGYVAATPLLFLNDRQPA